MSDRRQGEFPPSITAGKLYERTAASGRTYLTGFFGTFKITVFKTDDTSEKGDAIWKLSFGEAPPRNPDQSKLSKAVAERPRESRPSRPAIAAGAARDDEIPF